MAYYYVNMTPQPTGEHEVHISTCTYLKQAHNKFPLGECSSCAEAIQKAKVLYNNVDGCFYCCPQCHTK